MKRIVLLCTLLITFNSSSAQPLTLQTSNKYLELLKTEELFSSTIDVIFSPMVDGILKNLSDDLAATGLSETEITALTEVMQLVLPDIVNAALNKLDAVMPFERIQAEVYHPTLRESFTEEELSELIQLFSTPIGRKYINESVTIMQKSAELTQEKLVPALEAIFNEEFKSREEAVQESMQKAIENVNK